MVNVLEAQGREPAFDAIIPAPVRYCDELRANAKLLYGEIRALSGPYGYCWATNQYFADLYGMNERSIARLIAQLEKLKFITIMILRDNQGHISGRRIYVGCGFPEVENDTLTHMTKKSAYLTKKSGLPDQKDRKDINNNIINKKGDARAPACEKVDVQAEARAQLRAWASDLIGEEAEKELIPALMTYCDSRIDRIPPKKPNPLRAGRRTTGFTNKLIRFSNGVVPVMIALIDKAAMHGWDDLWPLKEDELRTVLSAAKQQRKGDDEVWL